MSSTINSHTTNIDTINTTLDSKNNLIKTSSTSGKTATLSSATVGTITSKSFAAGTWLILGSARFPSTTNTESGAHQYKICLSTSTSFDSSTEDTGINISSNRAWTMNCWGLFTLTASTKIYLLGYGDFSSTRDIDNGRLVGIKLL